MAAPAVTARQRSRYPLSVTVPLRGQRRWSVLARPLLALPAVVMSAALNVGAVLAVWAAAVALGRVPDWLFDFQSSLLRWHTRSAAYLLLLTDRFPPLDSGHPIACDLPATARVARRKVLVWKAITLVPHAIVLVALSALLVPLWVAGWLAATASGRLPLPLHAFAAGVLAWWARVLGYLWSLTDEFPPFSLRTTPTRARRTSYAASAVIGLVPATVIAAFAVYIVGFSGDHVRIDDVPYDRLRNGSLTTSTTGRIESGLMTLTGVTDPADDALALLAPAAGHRLVAFALSIRNWRGAGETVPVTASAFRLTTGAAGDRQRRAVLVAVNGAPGAGAIESGDTGTATVVFEVPIGARPARLRWDVIDYIQYPRRGETIDWNLT